MKAGKCWCDRVGVGVGVGVGDGDGEGAASRSELEHNLALRTGRLPRNRPGVLPALQRVEPTSTFVTQ